MAKSLFVGKLSNGVSVELLEAESFSGNTELAIKIAGEVASVSAVRELRTGDISVKTTSKAIRIKTDPGQSSPTPSDKPTLDDVAA